MITLNVYESPGFWGIMIMLAIFYTYIGVLTYNHLVRDDFHDWFRYGKINKEELKSLGLFLAIIWPVYWSMLLAYVIIRWILASLIALIKILIKRT